jgi:hypothetical protein
MGIVYSARHIILNKMVALKMLRAGALARDEDLRRFQNEAIAVARLEHPNIVPIYELGEHEGKRYFSRCGTPARWTPRRFQFAEPRALGISQRPLAPPKRCRPFQAIAGRADGGHGGQFLQKTRSNSPFRPS